MRSEFEKTKTYDLCKSWQIDFDEERQYYYSINPVFHADVTAINSAWRMFQEQQSKVDELQKKNAWLSDVACRENKRANKLQEEKVSTTTLLGKTIQEKNELQKRVDAVTEVLRDIKDGMAGESLDMQFIGRQLERALKGGSND